MASPGLLTILEQEDGSGTFQRGDNVWRPRNLFFEIQTQDLLKDMVKRYETLKESQNELKVLERATMYQQRLREMRLILKKAHFIRRANHLAFAQAVSEFYTAYGQVLRYLRIDKARGKLSLG